MNGNPLLNEHDADHQQKRLLWIMAVATFVVFFQAFMVAPLIPHLSEVFDAPAQVTGWAVPAYLIPYGFATLVYGLLSDRLGRRNLVIGSTVALIAGSLGTAISQDEWHFITWRFVTGVGAAAIVPLTLTLIGDRFPFERRGAPLGLIFAALAGGIAAGKTLGILTVPFIGWQGLFVAVALATAAVLIPMFRLRAGLGGVPQERPPMTVRGMFSIFGKLLSTTRGKATYSYVLLNSVFHGGVYTWLGVYFATRYGLDEIGIALAIIGYGIPGFLHARAIGRAADRWGRRWLIPAGLLISVVSILGLVPAWGVIYAALMVLLFSIGFDLTQPLFAGIVTDLGGEKQGGQAMGLNVFLLFNGFGLGAFFFGELLPFGFNLALVLFAGGKFLLLLGSLWLFRDERSKAAQR